MNAKLLRVAWLSVGLGLGMELILLAVAAGFGQHPTIKLILADAVQKVSWAVFVCVGVALGTAASRTRPAAMGLAGLCSGPAAFALAKALHKSAAEALAIAAPAAGGPSPLLLALLKGVEYGGLGAVVGWLGTKPRGAGVHIAAGLLTGLAFGTVVILLAVRSSAQPLPAAALAGRAINEILFPIGCSLVLYAAQRGVTR